MSPHRQHQRPDLETDEDTRLISRRGLLRRSALGITGVGLASLLVACGDDDEDLPAGLDGGGEPPGEDVPTVPVVEEELPADDEDDDD